MSELKLADDSNRPTKTANIIIALLKFLFHKFLDIFIWLKVKNVRKLISSRCGKMFTNYLVKGKNVRKRTKKCKNISRPKKNMKMSENQKILKERFNARKFIYQQSNVMSANNLPKDSIFQKIDKKVFKCR